MAKNSISLQELVRDDSTEERKKELMGGLEVSAAGGKVVSLLFLSLGSAGRKNVANKYPEMVVPAVGKEEFVRNCTECLDLKKNRTLERFKLFSRKQQKTTETLQQFWNTLNGLAAQCEFGGETAKYCV